ncbi:phosphonate C-P lyase system protein PhnH [Zavarzinia compransoris]|uniref:phosphonate C-P lyase system protein PhnH n=1 Tax=Zavarzinia marina TaxID=2911065 RepID=UPI001F264232|nr:phosphonate C-P lyase system protein PhnH [Zavarzinia marina]MCF4165066.1 phosphonate C-P lyase system protein PhnH [Zavarzinia marina]
MSDAALIDGLSAGFEEPVHQAQAGFRAVLSVLSRPGRVERLARPARAPAGLSPAAATVLAVLADLDTPVHLAGAGRAAEAFVAGSCGAPLAATTGDAAFAVVPAAGLLPLSRFAAGTADFPDRAATVIVEVSSLETGEVLTLSGPGIAGETVLRVAGLPAGFKHAWADQRPDFPLGVDLLLCCGDRVAGLPRTVAIR